MSGRGKNCSSEKITWKGDVHWGMGIGGEEIEEIHPEGNNGQEKTMRGEISRGMT